MLKSELNIKDTNGVDQKDLLETLELAYEIDAELRSKLSKIKINIDKNKNPELIIAIRKIFGETYISRVGNAVITYDMYCSTLNLIRTLGKSKAEEIL